MFFCSVGWMMVFFFRGCEHIFFWFGRRDRCYHDSFGRSYYDFWSVVMSVDLRIAMVQSHSGVPCSLTLDAVPGDFDLYVYLNIEMTNVRQQWVSFAAMPTRTLNPMSVVTVGNMWAVSCHSVVGVWLGCQIPCCSSLGCMLSINCLVVFTFINLC